MDNEVERTRFAAIGTMGDLHSEAAQYDLEALTQLAGSLAPDLLCLEVARAAWEAGAVGQAPLPIRAALAPVAERSNIVIVPVGVDPREHTDLGPSTGWRAALARALETAHRLMQKQASARTINGVWYGAFCHSLCALQEAAWTAEARAAWQAETAAMLANVLATIRRDPGRRVLLAAQCQRKHWLEARLRREAGVEVVDYWEL